MVTKRFLLSWICASLIMYGLFYAWHGLFLTDFSRLSYPKEIFLTIAALVYLMIGFISAKAIDVQKLNKYFKHKPLLKGAVSGAILGFVLFALTAVLGVSFSTGSVVENLLLDLFWQVLEQTIGGLAVGIVHIFVYDSTAVIED
jgi:hypothetical protein